MIIFVACKHQRYLVLPTTNIIICCLKRLLHNFNDILKDCPLYTDSSSCILNNWHCQIQTASPVCMYTLFQKGHWWRISLPWENKIFESLSRDSDSNVLQSSICDLITSPQFWIVSSALSSSKEKALYKYYILLSL